MVEKPCVLEKWRLQRDIETNTSLKCQFSKPDARFYSEKECIQQSQNNRDFYSEWGTIQRILDCDTYFANFATMAFKEVSTSKGIFSTHRTFVDL